MTSHSTEPLVHGTDSRGQCGEPQYPCLPSAMWLKISYPSSCTKLKSQHLTWTCCLIYTWAVCFHHSSSLRLIPPMYPPLTQPLFFYYCCIFATIEFLNKNKTFCWNLKRSTTKRIHLPANWNTLLPCWNSFLQVYEIVFPLFEVIFSPTTHPPPLSSEQAGIAPGYSPPPWHLKSLRG